MTKYRRKSAIIDAIEWKGDNAAEIKLFVGEDLKVSRPPHSMELNMDIPKEAYKVIISTLEGHMSAFNGDFIIKGVNGEFYPCKSYIFSKIYEKAE